MNFNQLLDAVREAPEGVGIPASWAQGRAAFGGLMAAMVYQAMCQKLSDDRPVRSLAISFVAPLRRMCLRASKSRCCARARRSARCWGGPSSKGRW